MTDVYVGRLMMWTEFVRRLMVWTDIVQKGFRQAVEADDYKIAKKGLYM